VYQWDVPATAAAAAGTAAAAADVVILVSGAKPCSSFRVWLQQPGVAEQSWVELTTAAAPLPVLQDSLVAEVREFR
jgi:hypothetical protein